MDDADGFDGVVGIGCELGFENVKVGSAAPLALDHVDVELEALLLIDPKEAELPDEERHDAIPGGQCVGQRALPRTRAYEPPNSKKIINLKIDRSIDKERERRGERIITGGWDEKRGSRGGLEDLLDVFEEDLGHGGDGGGPVILVVAVHGSQDLIRNVHRPRHKQVTPPRRIYVVHVPSYLSYTFF